MFYKRSNTATISKYLFTLPYSSVGLVIGHRGSTIKRINRESGAFCMFDRKRSSYNQRVFSVSGEIHQIDYAVKAIQSLLNVVLELHYDGSTIIFKQSEKLDKKKPTGYRNLKSTYQPMQQQFGYHQPLYIFDNNSPMLNNNTYHSIQKQVDKDYSLEWIHYYRNLGKLINLIFNLTSKCNYRKSSPC